LAREDRASVGMKQQNDLRVHSSNLRGQLRFCANSQDRGRPRSTKLLSAQKQVTDRGLDAPIPSDLLLGVYSHSSINLRFPSTETPCQIRIGPGPRPRWTKYLHVSLACKQSLPCNISISKKSHLDPTIQFHLAYLVNLIDRIFLVHTKGFDRESYIRILFMVEPPDIRESSRCKRSWTGFAERVGNCV
jgi:hypothetical protein